MLVLERIFSFIKKEKNKIIVNYEERLQVTKNKLMRDYKRGNFGSACNFA